MRVFKSAKQQQTCSVILNFDISTNFHNTKHKFVLGIKIKQYIQTLHEAYFPAFIGK